MSDWSLRGIALVISVAMVAALSATSVLGQSENDVQVAAGSGNAATVDGKSAVGANASATARAKKLVATNRDGRLPSNIIQPLWSLLQGVPAVLADATISWAEITGKPAGFADDVDNGAFASVLSAEIAVAAGASVYPSVLNVNRNIDVEMSVIPTTQGIYFIDEERLVIRNVDQTLTHLLKVRNDGAIAGIFRLRVRLYSEGIAPAALQKQAKTIEIRVSKRRPR